jgi:hypothetical protein
MTETHLPAPTCFVAVDGDRFAYRRWGNNASDQPPMLDRRYRFAHLREIKLPAFMLNGVNGWRRSATMAHTEDLSPRERPHP